MKILLLGKTGQVGWELQRSLAPLGSLLALETKSTEYCGDLINLDGLLDTVQRIAPDVIVNAAAYTAVDKAQRKPEVAWRVNAEAVDVLAQQAKQLGCLLVHYSTDYVFPGTGSKPWLESDPTSPLNQYGLTKHAGEQAIVASVCLHLIFRTSWVYAARGNNFAKTILRLAAERDKLNVIDDQIGAPTGAELLADITAHCIRATLLNPSLAGLYHLAAKGETSWYQYACFVLEHAYNAGKKLKISAKQLGAIDSSAYPSPVQRPTNSRLCTDKLEQTFTLNLPHWQHGVSRILTEVLETYYEQP